MLIDLPPGKRARLRPLFAGFPGLGGCVDGVLDGTMGSARVDDVTRPRMALLHLDFDLLAGDPNAPAAESTVRDLELPAFLVMTAGWEPLLRSVWGERLGTRTRVEFQPGAWAHERLRANIDALPAGFDLKRITTTEDAARFRELSDSLVYNFPTLEAFIEQGAGYGIEDEGRFVAGCASFAISPHSLEIDIQTHPDFRRRGLAFVVASAMVLHCIDARLRPEWDAQNEMSAALATKLGFVDPAPYTSYEIRNV